MQTIVLVGEQILQRIELLHSKGLVHRDIKPNNIMLDDMGMTKVLDFGVARSELDSRESQTQELQFGSVEYMAPERLFFEPETPASDVYSLGVTLYELLSGEKFGKARDSLVLEDIFGGVPPDDFKCENQSNRSALGEEPQAMQRFK